MASVEPLYGIIVDIPESVKCLTFVVFHELPGIVLFLERDQLLSHGALNVAPPSVERFETVDQLKAVVIRDINSGHILGLS